VLGTAPATRPIHIRALFTLNFVTIWPMNGQPPALAIDKNTF